MCMNYNINLSKTMMNKITNKLEKTIQAIFIIYGVIILEYVVGIFQDFSNITNLTPILFSILFCPIFLILTIFYKRKYKNINVNYINTEARILKIISLIFFCTIFFSIFITINILNIKYGFEDSKINDEGLMIYIILRDLFNFIWPVVLILFAINFQNKDINSRYQNLKNLTWSMFIFVFLINFSKMFAFLAHDIEVIILTTIKLFI